jgi:hypothetical protein
MFKAVVIDILDLDYTVKTKDYKGVVNVPVFLELPNDSRTRPMRIRINPTSETVVFAINDEYVDIDFNKAVQYARSL